MLTQVLERATLRVPDWPADAAAARPRSASTGRSWPSCSATLQGLAREHPAATW